MTQGDRKGYPLGRHDEASKVASAKETFGGAAELLARLDRQRVAERRQCSPARQSQFGQSGFISSWWLETYTTECSGSGFFLPHVHRSFC